MPGDDGSLRVLVVDDEVAIADTLVLILKSKGHDARASYSAEDAIETSSEFKPHAVVSDVRMSGMSGIDLAVHLAEHEPECKVLLMSGHSATAGLLEESIRNGHCLTVLAKPVHPDEILKFLQSLTPMMNLGEKGSVIESMLTRARTGTCHE